MVMIQPFRALRYNQKKVGSFNKVITPPYDVIDEEQRENFCRKSEYNMARLILGKEEHVDGSANKYSGVAKLFKEWQQKNIFVRDEKESIYIYRQTFKSKNAIYSRTGFISLLKLEELGNMILPHEKTLEKPLNDRLELINATKANFGSVFFLYDDRDKIIDKLLNELTDKEKPVMQFNDDVGDKHELWVVQNQKLIDNIASEMKRNQCIIADGHHRYKSVLRFRDMHPELKDADYTMGCFINSFNDGLLVLPIDRFLCNLNNISIDFVLKGIKEDFFVEEAADVAELIKKIDSTKILVDKANNIKNHVFGMYCYQNKKSYLLRLKNQKILDNYFPDKSEIYRRLDVNILHTLIFEKIFKISEEDQLKGKYIEYTKGSKRALEKLDSSKYQFAFFLNPTLMREIFLTARANETMPQKSTYFYPKLYSGVTINTISN